MKGIIVTQPIYINYKLPQKEVFFVDPVIINTKQLILSKYPILGSETVVFNGMELINGMMADYTLTENIVTINNSWPLYIGDTFIIKYIEE